MQFDPSTNTYTSDLPNHNVQSSDTDHVAQDVERLPESTIDRFVPQDGSTIEQRRARLVKIIIATAKPVKTFIKDANRRASRPRSGRRSSKAVIL